MRRAVARVLRMVARRLDPPVVREITIHYSTIGRADLMRSVDWAGRTGL